MDYLAVTLHCQAPMDVYTTPLGHKVIGCAIEVHRVLGPGLLESTYQSCTADELTLNGLAFQQQVALPILYKGRAVGISYRIDFLVEGELLVELKTVERFLPIHDAQVLTYLKHLRLRQGLLINFNVKRLVDGVRSILNSSVAGPELRT